MVLYNPDLDPQPNISNFPNELFDSNSGENFFSIIAEGEFECSNNVNSNKPNRNYMESPTVGASIAGRWNGTVGLFLETETEVMGLSCAHVLGNAGPDHAVTQPWSHDFKQSCQRLERRIAILQRNLQTITHDITRYVRNEELNEAKKKLELIQKLRGDDENETNRNLRFGTTTGTSEWDIVSYGNRQCIADYEFFKVDQSRQPSTSGTNFSYPEKGVLGSVTWALAERTGPLAWDVVVRKNGRTTGLTFGFIGGVYADWKPGKLGDKEFRTSDMF